MSVPLLRAKLREEEAEVGLEATKKGYAPLAKVVVLPLLPDEAFVVDVTGGLNGSDMIKQADGILVKTGPRGPADAERVSGDSAPREPRPASPWTGAGLDGRAGSTALRSAVRAPPACAAGLMHSTQARGAGIAAMGKRIRQSPQTHEPIS